MKFPKTSKKKGEMLYFLLLDLTQSNTSARREILNHAAKEAGADGRNDLCDDLVEIAREMYRESF